MKKGKNENRPVGGKKHEKTLTWIRLQEWR